MKSDLSKIRLKTAYTPSEIAHLFGGNRRTVFRWIEEGLELIDPTKKPRLILGADLKAFVIARREARKVKLGPNEFYCLKCKRAVIAKRGSQLIKKTGKTLGKQNRDQLLITAQCKACNANIARLS